MSIRFAILLTVAALLPAVPASAAKIDLAEKARDCPKQPPMVIALKRCPGLPPMLVAPAN